MQWYVSISSLYIVHTLVYTFWGFVLTFCETHQDKNGNPPGIIRDEEVDPLPPLFVNMIKRMVKWHVLPPTCVPNSCIVNIYEEGDCIPPHIDHHDFLRPFCTISFLTQCNILFGSNLKIVGPGEFSGPFSIPLPVGYEFILQCYCFSIIFNKQTNLFFCLQNIIYIMHRLMADFFFTYIMQISARVER